MTSYERVLSAVRHRQPDRPPLEYLATAAVTARLGRHLGVADGEALRARLGVDFRRLTLAIRKQHPVPAGLELHLEPGARLRVDAYGDVLLVSPSFPQSHRLHGPFYGRDDLDAFDWPRPADVEEVEPRLPELRRWNEAGLCSMIRCDNPFKIAYFMRPFDDFMVDCLERPDWVRDLLDRIARVETERWERGVRAGARAAMMFGDFADQRSLMVSPATFRELLKPVLAGMVARIREIDPEVLVFLHSDGNLDDVLPDLIECGFDAVHPIQPECMDMAAVKRRYAGRLTLFGGVSVQSELPRSRPEEIRRLVRGRVDSLGKGGGLILAPTNSMLPDIPDESIVALYEEGRKGEER